MVTAAELAQRLNGRRYRHEITKEEEAEARAAGLVVLFGHSDDVTEFRGAIHDEVGCYNGGTIYLTRAGLLDNRCGDDCCPYYAAAKEKAATIEALWCAEPDYAWTYRTAIPHVTFDIADDGEQYCRGIVFALAEVPA